LQLSSDNFVGRGIYLAFGIQIYVGAVAIAKPVIDAGSTRHRERLALALALAVAARCST
jgi:hypothetical protein